MPNVGELSLPLTVNSVSDDMTFDTIIVLNLLRERATNSTLVLKQISLKEYKINDNIMRNVTRKGAVH